MIVTLDEAKLWLRQGSDDDDELITAILIPAAEKYIKNATGKEFDSTNELAKLLCLVLITDWYDNREMIGKTSAKIRHTVDSILQQLSLEPGAEVEP